MGSAAVWICTYAPCLASGGRGPTAEGMLTLPVDSHQMHLFTHPDGVRLASAPRASHLSPGARLQVGDYALQVVLLAPHGDGNPAYDAAFARPGESIPRRTPGREEEESWEEALLSWFGLGEEDRNPPPRPDYPPAPVDAYPPPRVPPAPAYAHVAPRAVVSVDAHSEAASAATASSTANSAASSAAKSTASSAANATAKSTAKSPDATPGAAAELEALRARLAALEAAATVGTIDDIRGDDGGGSRRDGTGRSACATADGTDRPTTDAFVAARASAETTSTPSNEPARRGGDAGTASAYAPGSVRDRVSSFQGGRERVAAMAKGPPSAVASVYVAPRPPDPVAVVRGGDDAAASSSEPRTLAERAAAFGGVGGRSIETTRRARVQAPSRSSPSEAAAATPSPRREPARPDAALRVVSSTGPARLEPFATGGYDNPAWAAAAAMRHRAVSDSESDEDDVASAARFAVRATTTETEAATPPTTDAVNDDPAIIRDSRASVPGVVDRVVGGTVGGSADGELDALRARLARLEGAASERAATVVGDDGVRSGSLVRARAAMFGGAR